MITFLFCGVQLKRIRIVFELQVQQCHIHNFNAQKIVDESKMRSITFLRENNLELVLNANFKKVLRSCYQNHLLGNDKKMPFYFNTRFLFILQAHKALIQDRF